MKIIPKTVKQDKNYKRNLKTQINHLKTVVEVYFLFEEFDGNIKKISEFTGLSRTTIYKILKDQNLLKDLSESNLMSFIADEVYIIHISEKNTSETVDDDKDDDEEYPFC